jgi:hypothetical protein
MIIIDSPPVELVSDALVLAPMATHVSYVVKAMSTPAPLVRRNLTRIQRAGGNLLGVLVNRLDFKHARLYYGEYGASSYAYGGYGGNYGNAYGKGGAYGAGHAKKALAEERARLKQQADEGAQAAADAKAPTSAGVAGGAPSTQPMDKAA